MSYQVPNVHQPQVLFRADPHVVSSLKSVRDHVHHICRQHRNQLVRIETMDGHVYEGVLVHCDKGILYLSVRNPVPTPTPYRALSQQYYYNNVILPLVLYELLVITLLYV
ncbi:hypothetical protein [Paenibacillus silviterrae]|uniref:hypothetical protein n=1 Tax=Paenibacillus silviterrae TaxID=3242194 RepID=UPI00254374EA|nr:hypothetical protein [Paenibacillus chinjuensis]